MTIANTLLDQSSIRSQAPSPAVANSSDVALRRVLHVINGEHYAGAERVQDLLALCLPEFNYEVAFACIKPKSFPQQRKSQDTTLYELPMRSKLHLGTAKKLAQIVKFGGFDMIHAHTPRSALLGRIAAMLAKVPFVYHVHSPASNDSTRKFANKINGFLERVCLTGGTQMICVSESLAGHMQAQGFDPKRISVVPNGVPCRGQLGERSVPDDEWVLGTIGLFRPRKGIEVLIEALSILRGHGYKIRLRAVGPFETSDYEQKIRSLVAHYQVEALVDWTGFANDIDAELEQMDVMVLPSLFGEGLPMVVIEAMAAGVPVVGTRVQGVPEVLQEGCGLLAHPGCAQGLASTIRRILRGEEDWSAMRRNAWQRQADRYSDRSMAKGVAAVYDEIFARRA